MSITRSTLVGVDVGGTFTDLAWFDEASRQFRVAKVPSNRGDEAVGFIEGLKRLDAIENLGAIVHGTTVGTIALLERKGAKTGLITTAGFRDALEMRRGIREEQYNNRYTNVVPLVPRARRLGIRGRIDRDCGELQPLDLAAVRSAIDGWRAEGVQAVAVCFMNSFANPAHEQAAAELVRREWPEAYLSVSTEVLPSQ